MTTQAAHQLTTGQTVDISGGAFAGGVTNGHEGTHHITVTGATTFTYDVVSSRAPTGNHSGTTTYTTSTPEGTVVEFDSANNILFYVQTSYDSQGTNATSKQNVPFGGNGTITGDSSSTTAVPNVSFSSSLNNTTFSSGYATPEMQPDSGDVIYIENRKPISRASDQTEDVKLIVEF